MRFFYVKKKKAPKAYKFNKSYLIIIIYTEGSLLVANSVSN